MKHNPFSKFGNLSDTEWLKVLTRSIDDRVVDGVSFPGFPDASLQARTVGSSYEDALYEANKFYIYVNAILRRNQLVIDETHQLIDFGTCWGRIARFFLRDFSPENIIGLEVNDEFIEAARSIGMPIQIRKVQPLGPSDLQNESADLVTAYSVFSHLDEKAANSWMREFHRVLKPNGLLVATTEGEPFLDFCNELSRTKHHKSSWHETLSKAFSDIEEARRQYRSGHFVASKPYNPHYGEALIPPGYIMSVWGELFDLLEFRQAGQGFWQSIFVLRKRDNG